MSETRNDPDVIHFVGSLTLTVRPGVIGGSVVTRYGEELAVNPELRELNTDRVGRCALFDLLDDEEGQRVAWGSVRVRRGPWPSTTSRLEPGSEASREALHRARVDAQSIDDPVQRAARLREVFAFHDPQPPLWTVRPSHLSAPTVAVARG